MVGVAHSNEFPAQIGEQIEVVRSVELRNLNPWQTLLVAALSRRPKLSMEKVWPQARRC
jgi:hypothetical protein